MTCDQDSHDRASKNWQRIAGAALSSHSDPWVNVFTDEPIELVKRHRYIEGKWVTDSALVRIEKEPFTGGAMRHCFRMKKLPQAPNQSIAVAVDWTQSHNLVAKRFKAPTDDKFYYKDVAMQAEATKWAMLFNSRDPPKQIDMMRTYIVEFTGRQGSPIFAVERFITGHYLKHNSNSGFVEHDQRRLTPQCFSHFTFQESNGSVMVVDVQGVNDIYTDPQIHSSDQRFGDGDLGMNGMALFFHSHTCNPLCTLLELTPVSLPHSEVIIHTNDTDTCISLNQETVSMHASITSSSNTVECYSLQNGITPDTSLALLHYTLATLHIQGRFSDNQLKAPNAAFHLFQAARFGHAQALECIAHAFTGVDSLPSELKQPGAELNDDEAGWSLCDFASPIDLSLARFLFLEASKFGSKSASLRVANELHLGPEITLAAPLGLEKDWTRALELYENGTGDEIYPSYQVLIWRADILKTGGHGVVADTDQAAELYFEAGNEAMRSKDMFLSTQCFSMAEELQKNQ